MHEDEKNFIDQVNELRFALFGRAIAFFEPERSF
jgi:hypothetical protein